MPEPRPYAERRADTLALLARPRLEAWIATMGPAPHVSPHRIGWHLEKVLLAVPNTRPTLQHLASDPRVRVAVGDSSDCVVIDAEVTDRHPMAEMRTYHPELVAAYEAQVGHEPGDAETMLVIGPRRVQAWRGEYESVDRTLMQNGCWLVQPTSD